MIDLSRYDGHTPGPWSAEDHESEFLIFGPGLAKRVAMLHTNYDLPREHTVADARLMADAPALLAEVKALRESHARLLAALLLVGRVEKRDGVPYYNLSTHQDQMREIGAAVVEAEAL